MTKKQLLMNKCYQSVKSMKGQLNKQLKIQKKVLNHHEENIKILN